MKICRDPSNLFETGQKYRAFYIKTYLRLTPASDINSPHKRSLQLKNGTRLSEQPRRYQRHASAPQCYVIHTFPTSFIRTKILVQARLRHVYYVTALLPVALTGPMAFTLNHTNITRSTYYDWIYNKNSAVTNPLWNLTHTKVRVSFDSRIYSEHLWLSYPTRHGEQVSRNTSWSVYTAHIVSHTFSPTWTIPVDFIKTAQ
jgi:hypothetical protein